MYSGRKIARVAREKKFAHTLVVLVRGARSGWHRVPVQAGAARQVEQVPRVRYSCCSRSLVKTFNGLHLALLKSFCKEVDVFLDLAKFCGGVGGMQACMPYRHWRSDVILTNYLRQVQVQVRFIQHIKIL